MSWHVDAATAERYRTRRIDAVGAASVEAHVLECDECRAQVAAPDDELLLDAMWRRIDDLLDEPERGWIERLLGRVGCSDATARIIAATTRARWAYVFVVASSVLLAMFASTSGRDELFGAFLVVAPLGPLAATAGAFGRWADPASVLLATAPTSAWRVVLIRTTTAMVPAIALTAIAVPWLLDRGWLAGAWLLPALALSSCALALSSWIDVELATLALAGAWIAVPVALRLPVDRLVDAFAGPVQVMSIGLGLAALALTALRHSAFDYRET